MKLTDAHVDVKTAKLAAICSLGLKVCAEAVQISFWI